MANESKLPSEQQEFKILVRRPSETSDKYGKDPYSRSVEEIIHNGIVNINKPKGPTSHEISAFVQRILGLNKAGHSGTLDPGVTGVLPIATGKATKVSLHLLTSGKEYVAIMHLHKEVEEGRLRNALEQFVGKINQLPPKKSAVKRQVRERKVYYINVLETDGKDVLIACGVQAGTYIRKLIHDIGAYLGCGAHMAELVRTKAAGFTDAELWTLQDLTDAYHYYKADGNEQFIRKVVLPVERAVSHMKKVWIIDSAVNSICNGAKLKVPGISKLTDGIEIGDNVAVMTLKNELVAVGIAQLTSSQMMKEERGIAVKTDQVFMEPGTYPKID